MNIINNNFDDIDIWEWLDDTDDISIDTTDDLVFDVAIPILNVNLPKKTA